VVFQKSKSHHQGTKTPRKNKANTVMLYIESGEAPDRRDLVPWCLGGDQLQLKLRE
jgi:hypothetical protein